jgi:hypothetical protein
MSDGYTKLNLTDVEDAAVANGLGDRWQARVARQPLGAEQTGDDGLEFLAVGRHVPGDGQPVDDPWVSFQ